VWLQNLLDHEWTRLEAGRKALPHIAGGDLLHRAMHERAKGTPGAAKAVRALKGMSAWPAFDGEPEEAKNRAMSKMMGIVAKPPPLTKVTRKAKP
jgi:hypothetical protein